MLSSAIVSLKSLGRYRAVVAGLVLVTTVITILSFHVSSMPAWPSFRVPTAEIKKSPMTHILESIGETSRYFVDYPLQPSQFGELGKRVQIMREWISLADSSSGQMTASQEQDLMLQIEQAALVTFPYIRNPWSLDDSTPLRNIRQRVIQGSKGIVIPTGKGTFRFACHLIGTLRNVLSSNLPIQVVYAGNEDLPLEQRSFIAGLGSNIEMLDVTTVFDDTTLQLTNGGWAVKAFAVLASTFEQVLLMDADAVFIQKPEVIFEAHTGYRATGALLFHDRLLWQGAFQDRHNWWAKELKNHVPSATLNKSKVHNEGYAEEGDSGVVVLDKGRLPIFMGLLHICWQNTVAVRREYTYKYGYGDKESWWFGLELSDALYTFEDHYGAVIGHALAVDGKTKVCGFTIAHVGEKDKLLWYNGSLLKNKAVNKLVFDVPSHWMIDAVWEKGATKPDISCMSDGGVREVSAEEQRTVADSVETAKKIDEKIQGLVK